MAKEKHSITVEFPNEMHLKDFIDSVEESDFKEWVNFKIIKDNKNYLTSVEEMVLKIRKILSEDLDG